VVARERIADPDALAVDVELDGQSVQHFDLRDLVRPVARLIADITAFMTLHPGDVLLAGVQVRGPRARPGQSVAVRIDGIGTLAFSIVEGDA
jgi:5-oxopent-3-ene-1,2,5-tricarboxylate decarboxylase/2-hydroxyhepta-2,4-diene-1,7-dioate isomerase